MSRGACLPFLLTRVVDTGLDDIIHGEAAGGGLASQLGVDLLGQRLQQITHADQPCDSPVFTVTSKRSRKK